MPVTRKQIEQALSIAIDDEMLIDDKNVSSTEIESIEIRFDELLDKLINQATARENDEEDVDDIDD